MPSPADSPPQMVAHSLQRIPGRFGSSASSAYPSCTADTTQEQRTLPEARGRKVRPAIGTSATTGRPPPRDGGRIHPWMTRPLRPRAAGTDRQDPNRSTEVGRRSRATMSMSESTGSSRLAMRWPRLAPRRSSVCSVAAAARPRSACRRTPCGVGRGDHATRTGRRSRRSSLQRLGPAWPGPVSGSTRPTWPFPTPAAARAPRPRPRPPRPTDRPDPFGSRTSPIPSLPPARPGVFLSKGSGEDGLRWVRCADRVRSGPFPEDGPHSGPYGDRKGSASRRLAQTCDSGKAAAIRRARSSTPGRSVA